MFERILIPVDLKSVSQSALDLASDMAAIHGSRITLMTVLGHSETTAGEERSVAYGDEITSGVGHERPHLADHATAHDYRPSHEIPEAENTLAELASSMTADDATTFVAIGDPPSEIIAAAERESADLLIMVTHGRSGITRGLLGSVTETVVRHSATPVLVVRASR